MCLTSPFAKESICCTIAATTSHTVTVAHPHKWTNFWRISIRRNDFQGSAGRYLIGGLPCKSSSTIIASPHTIKNSKTLTQSGKTHAMAKRHEPASG
jgi:hypothetical protein